MRILCVVGMPGSGKTTVANVAKGLGIFTITTGDIVREEIKRRGLKYTEATDLKIGGWFHKYGRERVLVRRIVEKIIEANHPDPIVLEGLRAPEQLNELKKRLRGEKVSILTVHCPPALRREREKKRPRFGGKGYRKIKLRDKLELERGVGNIIAMADYVVVNDQSLQEFKKIVKNKLIEILNIKKR